MPDIYYLFGIPLIVYIVLLHVRLYQASKKTPAEPHPPPRPSEELTDFLADCKKHGYSFVRVDPSNVLYRSPRG